MGCRSACPANTNRPTARARTRSPSMPENNIAYVALYNANAIAVVDLNAYGVESRHGHDPGRLCAEPRLCWTRRTTRCSLPTTRASAPRASEWRPLRRIRPKIRTQQSYGVTAFNTHQDLGTVSIVPVPNRSTLEAMTQQVFQNNHWDLARKYLVGRRRQPVCQAGRNPGQDRRSVEDQARLPDHP